MRQLITRIDDDLHQRLKERAAAEGRSVNALVVDLLTAATNDPRDVVRAKLRARGMLYEPPEPVGPVPTWEDLRRAGAGAGSAVSEALEADRGSRW